MVTSFNFLDVIISLLLSEMAISVNNDKYISSAYLILQNIFARTNPVYSYASCFHFKNTYLKCLTKRPWERWSLRAIDKGFKIQEGPNYQCFLWFIVKKKYWNDIFSILYYSSLVSFWYPSFYSIFLYIESRKISRLPPPFLLLVVFVFDKVVVLLTFAKC